MENENTRKVLSAIELLFFEPKSIEESARA